MKTGLGRIDKLDFGFGGFGNSMLGLSISFKGKGWSASVFINGGWRDSYSPEDPKHKWTEKDRTFLRIDLCKKIDFILTNAKVSNLSQLINVPVEVIFDDTNKIKDWRILEEVL